MQRGGGEIWIKIWTHNKNELILIANTGCQKNATLKSQRI